MKVAIIGSRILIIKDLKKYLPQNTTEIVSGGAKGIDTCAKELAIKEQLKFTEFLPDYKKYGRAAPLKRNEKIVDYADIVLAFWDEKSKGTRNVIDLCNKKNKKLEVYIAK